jgi:hypothetical protein
VQFAAEVRHRGALVFTATFGPIGHEHNEHSLDSNRGEAVRFAASGGGARVRRPRLTAGDLQTPADFTLDVHAVNLARGCAVARLCAGITAEVSSHEPADYQQAALAFTAQLPSVCGDSRDGGFLDPALRLLLWFQAQDSTECPSLDSDKEAAAGAEAEEEDDYSSSSGERESLIVWETWHSMPADVERRMRARRIVVRPRTTPDSCGERHDEPLAETVPATLSFEDEEHGNCSCRQLCAALDVLHWAA